MPPARKTAKPDPHEGKIGWYDADGVWHEGLKPVAPDLETLIASAHPEGWVPEVESPYGTLIIGHAGFRTEVPAPLVDNISHLRPLLNLEEESRLAGIRARVHNGHAEHSDARFLLELLDRYMA